MATSLLLSQGPERRHLYEPEPAHGGRAHRPQRRAHRRRLVHRGPERAGAARAPARRNVRPASTCSRRPPSRGSPPSRSTPWWSRSGSAGTWDTTNVIHGDVAVLTNVSFDHTDVLGPTLEGIAADKAGIIEPESAVVLGDLPDDLRDIVEARAAEVGRGLGLGLRAGLRMRVEPGRGGRPVGHAVDSGRPLRGRPASRCTGRTRASTRRWLWPRWRPSSAARSPPRWWTKASPPSACPAGSRCWDAGRCSSSTARTTRRAWPRWATRCRGVRRRRDQGGCRRHALGSRPLRHAGAAGLGRRGRSRPVPTGLAAGHAAGRDGRSGPRTRAGRARGTRRARRACAWLAPWSTPTGSWWSVVRSTWSARPGPMRSRPAVPWEDAGR